MFSRAKSVESGEWQEHDTWVGKNRSIPGFKCETCSKQYEFYRELSSHYVIRKADADTLRSMKEDRTAEKAFWENIDKYEIPFR
jgi:hypothetical protein